MVGRRRVHVNSDVYLRRECARQFCALAVFRTTQFMVLAFFITHAYTDCFFGAACSSDVMTFRVRRRHHWIAVSWSHRLLCIFFAVPSQTGRNQSGAQLQYCRNSWWPLISNLLFFIIIIYVYAFVHELLL